MEGNRRTTGPAASDKPAWHYRTLSGVTVASLEGTHAGLVALYELQLALRTVYAVRKMLAHRETTPPLPITVYLVDSRDEAPPAVTELTRPKADPSGPNEIVLVRLATPDLSSESMAAALCPKLIPPYISRPFVLPFFELGITGYIECITAQGRTLKDVNSELRDRLARDEPVTVAGFEAVAPSPAFAARADAKLIATSFVAFLLTTFGEESFKKFLQSYESDRIDFASEQAYQQPLAVLEKQWLSQLRHHSARHAFRELWSSLTVLTKPYRRQQAELAVHMVLSLACTIAVPLFSKYLLDQIRVNFGGHGVTVEARQHFLDHTLLPSVEMLAVIFLVNAAVWVRRSYVTNWLNQQVMRSLQERMFDHLQKLPASFYLKAQVGDLVSRLISDLNVVQEAMKQLGSSAIYQVLAALVSGIVMLKLSPVLGALVLVIVPVFACTFVLLADRFQSASSDMQKLTSATVTNVEESLYAQAIIKAFCLESKARAKYHLHQMAQLKATMRIINLRSYSDLSQVLSLALAQTVILGVGGYMVVAHTVSVGTLVAFYQLLPQVFGPVAFLTGVSQNVQLAAGALERVNEVLSEPVTISDRPGARDLEEFRNCIEFSHVEFAYEPGIPILQDVNLTIPVGTSVAFVGPSGSGKSTTINLLLRFWDVQGGSITLDGVDIRDITLDSLRSRMGIVFQDTFVFDTTIRENIAIGRPGATDEEIKAAAAAAQLHAFIESLPSGYDTVLGERGARMSGGQRQRLAIARVVLKDPAILILDEATSALDAHTEAEIQSTLAAISQGRTTISVTHRLASARDAACIFVVSEGRIAERGTHSELLEQGGVYKRLYEEQMVQHPPFETGAA